MKRIFTFILILSISIAAIADEGMWVPMLLKKYTIEQMQAKGFKLSAEDIYDINHSSLKDAVMLFGGGCTAELISPQGLLITNHHCGYSYIVRHSTVKHDYLTNGFWAYSKEEELPNPGLTVTFLEYMEDVTDKIIPYIPADATENQRKNIVEKLTKQIVDSVEKHWNNKYQAVVKPFYYGNQYILIVNKVYKDVRLVGAPPSAIGKFGGETDNWMWPRHTGDFSMFRIYANKNNEPAEYSPDNIPYRPKKFLKISLKGVEKDDFTMVFGYPGSTEEYVPSYAIDMALNTVNPSRIKLRQTQINILNALMQEDIKYRLMYATRVARLANGWKKWIGENKGLRRLQVIKQKKEFEQKFELWTQTSEGKTYKGLLEQYKKLYKQAQPYQKAYYYFVEAVYYQPLYSYVTKQQKLANNLLDAKTEDERSAILDKMRKNQIAFFENHHKPTEKKIFAKLMHFYMQDLEDKFIPDELKNTCSIFNNPEQFADFVFEYSILLDNKLLEAYNDKQHKYIKNQKKTQKFVETLKQDPIVVIYNALTENFVNNVSAEISKFNNSIDSLNRLYMAAQMKMQPNKVFYPDANMTLRVAYGTVKGYKPRDAVEYDYYTTIDGIIEKDDPDIYDYRVPQKLKELYEKKDYGQYADKDGNLHVCFIANNHTTGGNSGSPVLDAEGNLIGVNFDRTWESTMSDFYYDADRCRNIILDIRYALFIIDKYAGAHNLIKEMEFVK